MTHDMNKLTSKDQNPPHLSPQRKRFADAILTGENQTQATVTAGYSLRSAYNQGDRLMKYDDIKAYIAFYQVEIARRNAITQDEIVSGIRDVIVKLKDTNRTLSSATQLLKGYELLAKMGGFLREQGIDPEQRPAFVGISINMGDGKVDVKQTRGNSGGNKKNDKQEKTDIINIK